VALEETAGGDVEGAEDVDIGFAEAAALAGDESSLVQLVQIALNGTLAAAEIASEAGLAGEAPAGASVRAFISKCRRLAAILSPTSFKLSVLFSPFTMLVYHAKRARKFKYL